ncbi:MAG: DUF4189 domain-containing protein [Candidatus Sericytochromatia bacterium]
MSTRTINWAAATAVLAGTLAGGAVAVAGPAHAQQDVFAAIAYSETESYAGWVVNASSQQQAENGALNQCESQSNSACKVAAWVKNGCVALALDPNDKWSGGYGPDSAAAGASALKELPKGKVVKVACTPTATQAEALTLAAADSGMGS